MKSYYPVDVKVLDNYRLYITFNNNEKRVFNVLPYLEDEFYAPLQSTAIFNTVKINPLTIEWVGGIDMCPDEVYYNSIPANS